MLVENTISIYDFTNAIAETLDLASPALNSHHNRVAYIAYNIALEMGLPPEEVHDITLAALVHDIGAFSLEERERLLAFEDDGQEAVNHCLVGYRLLKDFGPLAKSSALIAHHHTPYDPTRHDVPLGSYVIHLADRIAVLLDEGREVFSQLPGIADYISASRISFHPDALAAFNRMTGTVYVWVEVFSPSLGVSMMSTVDKTMRVIGLNDLRSLARVFAQIIDFRNRFTATHSSGVAAVAMELASIAGFSERECRLMEIAGYLHDLGKLAVPTSILEKPGPLDDFEWMVMRKHTYYTHSILSKISGLEDLATWAAYHHERLDGTGYPFNVCDDDLSKLSRIMSVADVVTALSEDRPYRLGLDGRSVLDIVQSMVASGALDRLVVDMARQSYESINRVRISAQAMARAEYDAFYSEEALGQVPAAA